MYTSLETLTMVSYPYKKCINHFELNASHPILNPRVFKSFREVEKTGQTNIFFVSDLTTNTNTKKVHLPAHTWTPRL